MVMVKIREATVNDVPVLHSLIAEMAKFEKMPLSVTQQMLADDGFVSHRFRVLIAEFNSQPAGYALFFNSYSTFQGRGLFLEDIFVRSEYRKNKMGQALFARVAAVAKNEGCFGVIFHVLDWNETAIHFYKKMGATFRDDWKTVCLKGEALHSVATLDTTDLDNG